MQRTNVSERFPLTEWARLDHYHPAVQLMATWAWSRPARGEPPLSPGGFAGYIGVSRRVVTRWLQAPVMGPLPLFTLSVARQVARATELPLDQLLIAAEIAATDDPLFDTRGAWAFVIAQVEQREQREQREQVERPAPPEPDRFDGRDGDAMQRRHFPGATADGVTPSGHETAPAAPGSSDGSDDSDGVLAQEVDARTAQWAADLAAGRVTLRDLCARYLRAVAPTNAIA